ncbi:tRNA lysidine(34) synthetase TilS [Rhodanobacter sp. L36]|uniref:tRNA lysidine(34) synthetase TilS n=1 Tax=Rhodanobacter sp. L36 TaxID=1747221 RepID=UPI0031B6A594
MLQAHLRAVLTEAPATSLCVAFSGGPDSTALLHALAQLPEARERGLRALHVDHGMHAKSSTWADHCRHFCEELELPCEVLRVHLETGRGEGIEAAARRARYDAFTAQLREGEWLLLAHHRDDQAETVLLKLLRGAGPEGLGGMRELRPFARGQLWRPLLSMSRAQLRAYVDQHQLHCIADPSNDDTRLARNHLRHEILPRLTAHWPQAVDSIVHSASLSRAAANALQVQWMAEMENLHDQNTGSLHAAGWLALAPALREPLLDHWLHSRGLAAPTAAQRREIEKQCHARAGQLPCVRWTGVELHVWKGRLWSLAPQPEIDATWTSSWTGEPLLLPDGSVLSLRQADVRFDEPLQVGLRRGGERIKPAGDAHTRELRDLFQHTLMPPWQRGACPLIHIDGELIGVADRWLTSRGAAFFEQAGSLPAWRSADAAQPPATSPEPHAD